MLRIRSERQFIHQSDISRVSLRKWILSILAISFAIIFIFLGFWQIRRLRERQSANDLLAARRLAPEVDIDSLPRDTAAAHFRRVHISGSYDYPQEIIYTLRGRNGSPGVNILTPLLQRQALDIPPATLFAFQILLGVVFGIWGLALALPLMAIAKVMIDYFKADDPAAVAATA